MDYDKVIGMIDEMIAVLKKQKDSWRQRISLILPESSLCSDGKREHQQVQGTKSLVT